MECLSLLSFFFLIFGAFILKLFDVPLAMVRIVGGIILMRIGFSLFMPGKSGGDNGLSGGSADANIAFVPLAIPLIVGPGAIATIIGMTATIKTPHGESFRSSPSPPRSWQRWSSLISASRMRGG
jgi:multiple antibiotic resistance protein